MGSRKLPGGGGFQGGVVGQNLTMGRPRGWTWEQSAEAGEGLSGSWGPRGFPHLTSSCGSPIVEGTSLHSKCVLSLFAGLKEKVPGVSGMCSSASTCVSGSEERAASRNHVL